MATKVIISEDETEYFQRSTCNCNFYENTHKSIKDWDRFTPETNSQKNRMEKYVIFSELF